MPEKNRKPEKCSNCGGSEFKLLPSGTYKCTYCGTEMLPREIQVHQVSLENSFSGFGAFFKKVLIPAILLLAVGGAAFFWWNKPAIEESRASEQIEPLLSAYANVKAQEERAGEVLNRYEGVMQKKYKIPKKLIRSRDLKKIYEYLFSQDTDEMGMRIQDELNGALNRLATAKRRFRQAYELYQSYKSPQTEKLLREKIEKGEFALPKNESTELKTGK